MEIGLKELLEAGCHFGHQTVRWNPKMKPYIFAQREGVHVFDLAKTKEGLESAGQFFGNIISDGGQILLLGTKKQAREEIKKAGEETNMPYINQRWLGGLITNWDQVKKSIEKLSQMKDMREKGEYKGFTKKEQLLIDRQITKLEKFLGGVANLKELPKALFVIDVKREKSAVLEANRKGIPVIGIVDTNSNPDLVDYVIPANDDAASSIKLIVEKISQFIQESQKQKSKQPKETEIRK